MSFFSGLTNQVSGFIASKTGQGDPNADPNADPNLQQQPPMNAQENGGEYAEQVEGGEQAQAGGVSGFAQGLMMKAMAGKEAMKEKAGAINTGNIGAMGGQLMSGVTNLIPGRKEEEVPPVPDQNQEGYVQQGDVQYQEGGEVQYTE